MKFSARTFETQQLSVSNFGPILDANLELRPLTIFVGPSNTGKSYLAILVYALHKFLATSASVRSAQLDFIDGDDRLGTMKVSDILKAISIAALQSKVETESEGSQERRITLSKDVVSTFVEFLNSSSEELRNSIERCFSRDLESLQNILNKEIWRIKFKRDQGGAISDGLAIDFQMRSKTLGIRVPNKIDFLVPMDSLLIRYASRLGINPNSRVRLGFGHPSSSVLELVIQELIHQLVGDIASRAHYLPADRTAVMHAHQVVVSSALQTVAETGLRTGSRTGVLTGVQADFLSSMVVNIARRTGRQSNLERSHPRGSRLGSKYAKSIEDDILQGSIVVDRDELLNYPSFYYQPRGTNAKIPLVSASSTIGELAPVVLYLRHIVRPGDLLIVEEPESHLHPAMQIRFFQMLVGLVREGLRVLITTHSEWLLEELTNIVIRSRLSSRPSDPNTPESVSLNPKYVGVWLFKPDLERHPQLGSSIKEIERDKDGTYTTGYEEVAHQLYNNWASITSRLDEEP